MDNLDGGVFLSTFEYAKAKECHEKAHFDSTTQHQQTKRNGK